MGSEAGVGTGCEFGVLGGTEHPRTGVQGGCLHNRKRVTVCQEG